LKVGRKREKVETICGKVIDAGTRGSYTGSLLVTRGERAGQEVQFALTGSASSVRPFLRFRLPLRLRGTFRKGVFEVSRAEDASADLSREDLVALARYGRAEFNLTEEDIDRALEASGHALVYALVLDCGHPARKIRIADALEKKLGKDASARFLALVGELAGNAGVLEVCQLLRDAGVPADVYHGLRIADALRYRTAKMGLSPAQFLRQHPYALAEIDPDWLEWSRALAAKYPPADPDLAYCVGAAVAELRRAAGNGGHACMRRNELWARLAEMGIPRGTLERAFERFDGRAEAPELVRLSLPVADSKAAALVDADRRDEARVVYLRSVFFDQDRAVRAFREVLKAPGALLPVPALQARMQECAGEIGLAGEGFSDEQLSVVKALGRNKVVVVTGQAGSGKTAVVKGLVRAFSDFVALPVLAPTGIAAQRAAANTGGDPRTIHRFARIWEVSDDVAGLEDDELAIGRGAERAPVVVVDEMSMCTVFVFSRLLWICSPETRFLLVGDPGQLPPIGPGGIFDALIRLADAGYPGMAHVELTGNYRTRHGVTLQARRVRAGEGVDPSLGGVRLVEVDGGYELVTAAVAEVGRLVGSGAALEDILVLAPTRFSDDGVNTANLNRELRHRFGQPTGIADGDFVLGKGDPVVATVNDYQEPLRALGLLDRRNPLWIDLRRKRPAERVTVFNGTRGVVEECGPKRVVVRWFPPGCGPDGVEAAYLPEEVKHYLEPAWAMTVHKAQGGQAKHVVLVLPGNRANDRRRVYTGITRCQGDEVVIVTDRVGARKLREGGLAMTASRCVFDLKVRLPENNKRR